MEMFSADSCGGCFSGLFLALFRKDRSVSWCGSSGSVSDLEDLLLESPSARMRNTLLLWKGRGGSRRRIEDCYDYVDRLGEGAFGVVTKWAAKQNHRPQKKHTEQFYAVKQIRWQHVWHRKRRHEAEEGLRQELRTLLSLDHPHIAGVREWFEDSRRGLFVVMELCEGGSLQDVLEGQVCQEKSAVARTNFVPRLQRYFRELLYAVAYIHSKGIVHRDLKPENILLRSQDPESSIKIIDFGLATLADNDAEGDEWLRGTMVFMAPEFYLTTSGQFTDKSDMWSLGVLLTWFSSAVTMGSLQHPMLDVEDGEAFDVRWPTLHNAFREKQAVHQEYFSAATTSWRDVADLLLKYNKEDRASAAQCLQTLGGDEESTTAAPASTDLGAILSNLQSWGRLNTMEKNLLSLATLHLSQDHHDLVGSLFEVLDVTKTGRLCKETLEEGLMMGWMQSPTADIADKLVQSHEEETVHYHDFVASTVGASLLSDEVAATVFQDLDTSGCGKLRMEQLSPLAGCQTQAEAVMDRFCQRRNSRSLNEAEFSQVFRELSFRHRSFSGSFGSFDSLDSESSCHQHNWPNESLGGEEGQTAA